MAAGRRRILIFNRSFWPDMEATGQFITELSRRLAERYEVTVITGRSYYVKKDYFGIGRLYKRETYDGIEIFRIRHTRFWKKNLNGRIANWVTFSALALIAGLRKNADIIIVCTDPPFLGIIGMAIGRIKGTPFIYNCRDLFPDVAWGIGRIKKTNLLGRAFDYINKKALGRAARVICLGASMEKRIRQKDIPRIRIKRIPDWVDTCAVKPIPKDKNPLVKKFGLDGQFVIMHSGNIGLTQEFDSILKAAAMLKGSCPFSLVFIGEGAGKRCLKEKAESRGLSDHVFFFPYQPFDMLSYSLSLADLHVVAMKKGMAGAVVPSKVYGIMAAARPYLAVTDIDSEPADMAQRLGCGLWADPDKADKIAEAIRWAAGHPDQLRTMGMAARKTAVEEFDKNIIIQKWFAVLDEI
ncbi:MAG: glycosyltransferase family 4 protein [Candidatus Omnitrophica bacterium]|nr:glycosyltransferase family 4 protein [Candidatus Omnitrophota bacterium]